MITDFSIRHRFPFIYRFSQSRKFHLSGSCQSFHLRSLSSLIRKITFPSKIKHDPDFFLVIKKQSNHLSRFTQSLIVVIFVFKLSTLIQYAVVKEHFQILFRLRDSLALLCPLKRKIVFSFSRFFNWGMEILCVIARNASPFLKRI